MHRRRIPCRICSDVPTKLSQALGLYHGRQCVSGLEGGSHSTESVQIPTDLWRCVPSSGRCYLAIVCFRSFLSANVLNEEKVAAAAARYGNRG